MTELSGWGRYPRHLTDVRQLARPQDVAGIVTALDGHVARGNGRAYGDAAIGERATLMAGGLNRMMAFDAATGVVTVEAGVLLGDIIAAFGPRGFFPRVVPGTKFVTVGGAIAADVHGKNHHRDGGFGNGLVAMRIALPSGAVVTASRMENAALFDATLGGMGLTGTIIDATLALRPIESGWIRQQTLVARNLDDAISALEAADGATYSVAWIDGLAKGASLGRALVYLGEHASAADVVRMAPANAVFPAAPRARFSVPVEMPSFTLNPLSVRAFNEAYYRAGARHAGDARLVHWHPYFFPLDSIGGWNKIYGRQGFVQHQCVIPMPRARAVISEILERTAARGDASFLAVLKKLGSGGGLMSFPMPGLTLTLDFKMSGKVAAFLEDIDRLVVDAGGRLYLAKDARQSRATFESGYPALAAFRDFRRGIDADRRIVSKLSTRLGV
ncbi:MAG: FAD-binding protein [Hyphomicrobium sp.]